MIRALAIAVLLSSAVIVGTAGQEAHDDHDEHHVFEVNGIEVLHPWARAATAGEQTFVFFELHNETGADRLLGASTPVAAEIHIVGLTIGADGTAVQEVGAIDIPPGAFAFDPGGVALELHGLSMALEQGGHFDLTLEFEVAGRVDIEVAVEAADARQHSHAGHSH